MSKSGILNITTPKKARIRGAADFNNAMGIPFIHADLFRFYSVSKQQGWAILKEGMEGVVEDDMPSFAFDCTHYNNPADARVLTWAQLSRELDFGVSSRTLQQALGSLDYYKCRCAKQQPNNWHDVRFSNKAHCSPSERYCSDCIQEQLNRNDERERETSYIWAAVGYNFKSNLTFYDTPGNRNGKLSLAVYRDQILELVVGAWLRDPDTSDFILEEDNNSGHRGGRSTNIVATWKRNNGLNHYFNCSSSPDLSLIENCWQPMKQHLKKHPHWDEFEVRELANEGWGHVTYSFINERIDSMPQRLQDCIDMEGRITGH
ncbi:hypothetical protein CC86DRAFT_445221 [Ophiobolus disseminans]|uniref:Tc1-like transposase DDE domain-containing protein n=1 Tax=Ophiobolus disseminans TaxID=1469910 RepID=A0A6A7A4L6_9PLEO|nr:hypothetical protein CC86DRAFT_445221 [Ophiobolus disseminans]